MLVAIDFKQVSYGEQLRNFTLDQLKNFNGQNGSKIYISLNGTVFDVSLGREFYGPHGIHESFAGRECGLALAKMSFDTEFITDDLTQIQTLNYEEKLELEKWIKIFTSYRSYPIVGRYIPNSQLPNHTSLWTREDLMINNGLQDIPNGYAIAPIYIGLKGKVYDVSFGGGHFYSEGCSYHAFAGLDATFALAKMSFDHVKQLQVKDLSKDEENILEDWVKRFNVKYPVVGVLK